VGGANVKKKGHNDGQQTYQCKDCGKRFRGGIRIQNVALWSEYVGGHRTLVELASLYGCSERRQDRPRGSPLSPNDSRRQGGGNESKSFSDVIQTFDG